MSVSKPRILFVGLWYQHYTRAILDELQLSGCLVDYIDIQPRRFWHKVMKTLDGPRFQTFLDHHHAKAIRAVAGSQYDQVLFLQAHQMSGANLMQLRRQSPEAKFTLYNWDSLSNHDYLDRVPYFDRVATFDKADADLHGFDYLPLFAVRPVQKLRRDRARTRSVFMVGNIVNIDRYQAVEDFRAYCRASGIEFRTHLVTSPVVWWRMVARGIRPRGVHFKSMRPEAFKELTESSLAVFDFANHRQSGYTMRTIENLCAGKKIITNNPRVMEEPFYSPDRIHCFSGTDFSGVLPFLDVPISEPGKTFDAFSIQTFTRNLLGLPSGEPVE